MASLVEARICGRPPEMHRNFSLPTLHSFDCEVLEPTSSANNKGQSGLMSLYSVSNPKWSCSLSIKIPSFECHCLFGFFRNSPTTHHHLFVHFVVHGRKWKIDAPVCSATREESVFYIHIPVSMLKVWLLSIWKESQQPAAPPPSVQAVVATSLEFKVFREIFTWNR